MRPLTRSLLMLGAFLAVLSLFSAVIDGIEVSMQAIFKNPITTIFGVVAAATTYLLAHPGEVGPVVTQIAGIVGPLATMLLGAFAADHKPTNNEDK